jgi:uncharacterized protein DUF4149
MSPRPAARAATKLSQSATSNAFTFKALTSKALTSKALKVLLVLWAGSLWSAALWVAPTLFYAQSDKHLAGMLVTRLFSIETYLALSVAALALLSAARARFRLAYFAAALLALNEWLLKTFMTRAHAEGHALGLGFGAWHGISALVYVSACVLVLLLVWNDDFR